MRGDSVTVGFIVAGEHREVPNPERENGGIPRAPKPFVPNRR